MENIQQSSESLVKDFLQSKKRKSLSSMKTTSTTKQTRQHPPPLAQIIPSSTEGRNEFEASLLSPDAFEGISSFPPVKRKLYINTKCQAKEVFQFANAPPPPPPATASPTPPLNLHLNQSGEFPVIIEIDEEIPSTQFTAFNEFDQLSQINETNDLLKSLTHTQEQPSINEENADSDGEDKVAEDEAEVNINQMEREIKDRVGLKLGPLEHLQEKLILPTANYWLLCEKELGLKNKLLFHNSQYNFHHNICLKILTELKIITEMKNENFL